jgi:carbonic anhydrase/acetyltransferase-like protein (isoleucine patch superfamily)
MRSPRVTEPVIHPDALILPGAQIHGQVSIARGALVLFGAVIRAELDRIDIGADSNIQDNAVLHCDEDKPCLLGDRVTVGHAAVVHGAVVGDRCLIAIGAILLNGSRLGEGAWLGAGSVLAEGAVIPEWTLAIGTPAKPVRDLTDEEITRADEGVEHYLDLREIYRAIV